MADVNVPPCQHHDLRFVPSPHADIVGFERASSRNLLAATELSGRLSAKSQARPSPASAFPGPLVLPGDDLAWDSKYPCQSVCAWNRLKERNHITEAQSTLYIIPPPTVTKDVEFLTSWSESKIPQPKMEDIVGYLQAFYVGLEVKILHRPKLQFIKWDDEGEHGRTKKARSRSQYPSVPAIGLQYSNSDVIKIRARACPDKIVPGQMDLNDILDVCIDILPDDAFAVAMVLPYDLYESDDDDFCCGRAFGGSRVSVISTARYNPDLDVKQGVETIHAWPASHCAEYIAACCADHNVDHPSHRKQRNKGPQVLVETQHEPDVATSPLRAAVTTVTTNSTPKSTTDGAHLWLSRVCKTVSHELGHCLGIDHCTYYACIMQGTANLSEDARQPPYLCPIDLVKVLRVTGAQEVEHLKSLKKFCERYRSEKFFLGFGAWIDGRLELLNLEAE